MHMYETPGRKRFLYFWSHTRTRLFTLFCAVVELFGSLCSSTRLSAARVNRTADQNITKTLLGFRRATCDFSPLSLCKLHPGELHRRRALCSSVRSPSYYIAQQQCSLWENISNILAMSPGEFLKRALNPDFCTAAQNKRPGIEKGYYNTALAKWVEESQLESSLNLHLFY